jgi:hypothetical protein
LPFIGVATGDYTGVAVDCTSVVIVPLLERWELGATGDVGKSYIFCRMPGAGVTTTCLPIMRATRPPPLDEEPSESRCGLMGYRDGEVNFRWAKALGVPICPTPWETPRDWNSESPDDGKEAMAGVTGLRGPRLLDVSARVGVTVAVPVGRELFGSLPRLDCFYGVF